MIPVTRRFPRTWSETRWEPQTTRRGRPCPDGGARMITGPLPSAIPGQQPFAGMDPSNEATWVRQFNPQPGMIAYLNYNGAAVQSRQPTGGLQRGRQQRRRGYAG